VTHVVPEGFRFVRADHSGEFDDSSRTVTWNIDHLDVHQSTPVSVDLATTQIGKCTHTVAAVAEQGARSELKMETVVDGVASLAVEILKQSDPVEVGVETGYEIHVRNDGSKAAENVSVACDIPSVLELVRTEGATSVADIKDQLSFRPLPLLEPGKAAIYRVHVRARAEGSHRFAVRLTADSIKEPLTYTELTKFYKE
jgi:nucleoid-associated protein YgaU